MDYGAAEGAEGAEGGAFATELRPGWELQSTSGPDAGPRELARFAKGASLRDRDVSRGQLAIHDINSSRPNDSFLDFTIG